MSILKYVERCLYDDCNAETSCKSTATHKYWSSFSFPLKHKIQICVCIHFCNVHMNVTFTYSKNVCMSQTMPLDVKKDWVCGSSS